MNTTSIKVPPEALIDPAKIRADEAAKAAEEWTEELADKIIALLSEHNVLVSELPTVMVALTTKVNKKWNNAEIASIIKL